MHAIANVNILITNNFANDVKNVSILIIVKKKHKDNFVNNAKDVLILITIKKKHIKII
jgi:hypothetical protein